MSIFLILGLLFFLPLTLLIAWLILSSCLGDSFRARTSGFSINPRHASYDKYYFRTMANSNTVSACSEQIELQDMLEETDADEGVYEE
ncbi:hypothetical protein MMC10_011087 [Thelotrema lepadinum]|nr:hypothetical protein [Thelotrema lepadinum]